MAYGRARDGIYPIGVVQFREVLSLEVVAVNLRVFVAVELFELADDLVNAQGIGYVHAWLLTRTFLCGHEDDTVGSARAVDGSGKSILENFDALDVLGIECGQGILLERVLQIHVVIQRAAACLHTTGKGDGCKAAARYVCGVGGAVGAIDGHTVDDIEGVVVADDAAQSTDGEHVSCSQRP